MKRILIILVIAITPLIVRAQDPNLRLVTSIGGSSGASYENPIFTFGVAGSFEAGRTIIDTSTRYSFARKVPGGGHNVSARAVLRVPTGKLFVGPAFDFSRQTTSIYSKTAAGVGAQIGKRYRNVILSGTFTQDFVSVNKARNYTMTLEWYGRPRGRFTPYVAGSYSMSDFRCHETGHGPVDHCVAFGGQISVGLTVWRKRSE